MFCLSDCFVCFSIKAGNANEYKLRQMVCRATKHTVSVIVASTSVMENKKLCGIIEKDCLFESKWQPKHQFVTGATLIPISIIGSSLFPTRIIVGGEVFVGHAHWPTWCCVLKLRGVPAVSVQGWSKSCWKK